VHYVGFLNIDWYIYLEINRSRNSKKIRAYFHVRSDQNINERSFKRQLALSSLSHTIEFLTEHDLAMSVVNLAPSAPEDHLACTRVKNCVSSFSAYKSQDAVKPKHLTKKSVVILR
jgi:hypothetical protein